MIGIDLSPEMLARAQARIERHSWGNVTLIEDAAIPVQADAALLCGVHDILCSPPALANGISHVRAGGAGCRRGREVGAVVATEQLPTEPRVWLLNRDYVTTFEGFPRPWSHLARLLPELDVEEVFLGGGFITAGTTSTAPGTHARTLAGRRRLRSAQRSQRHARLASDRTDESN